MTESRRLAAVQSPIIPVIADLIRAGTTFTTPPGGVAVKQGSTSAGLQVVLEGSANVDVR